MSDNNQNTSNPNPATTTETPKPSKAEVLKAEFLKSGAIVFPPGEVPTEFETVVNELSGVDWSNDKFPGLAFVQTKPEENGTPENRVIAIPSMADVFSDATARANLYNRYVRILLRVARKPDANQAQFQTVSGPLGEAFDLDAFRFQAKQMVATLRALAEKAKNKQVKAIGVNSLRKALSNSGFAKAIFAGFDQWDRILDVMSKYATEHGYSTAIFDHWRANRDAGTFEAPSMTLGTAEELLAAMETAESDEDENE